MSENKLILAFSALIVLRNALIPEEVYSVYDSNGMWREIIRASNLVSRCAFYRVNSAENNSFTRVLTYNCIRNIANPVIRNIIYTGKINFTTLSTLFLTTLLSTIILQLLPKSFFEKTKLFWCYLKCEIEVLYSF